MKWWLAPSLGLVLAVAPDATAATAPPQLGPRRAEFGAEITIVTLPVFVTDARGVAVQSLAAQDFEVLDDGRPVKLVGLREFDASDPRLEQEILSSPAARRQFLLLFDLSFSNVAGLVRAQKAAAEFIARELEPLDLAAVATFSANHGVRMLVGLTSDRGQLLRAVSQLGVMQLDRRPDPLGLVYDLTDVGSDFADTTSDDRTADLQDTIRQIQVRYQQAERAAYRQRVLALFEGLSHLAAALDVVQGRKQVVLLSSGFDSTILMGEDGARAAESSEAVSRGRYWEVRSDDRFGDTGLRAEMERALRSFVTSDAVIHTVDLSGLTARGDTRFRTSEPAPRSGQDSLARIANLSGGRLFKSTNDVGVALRGISAMSRRYYLLAFEPEDLAGPGRFHKLKIRLRGKRLQVSHRSGYFERKLYAEQTPLARQFEAAELIAKGTGGGAIRLSAVAVPYRAAAGRVALRVVLEAEGASLLDRPPADALGLETYGYALDERGSVEDLVAVTSNLRLAEAANQIRAFGVRYQATFTLDPGRHQLRFLVRDAQTGRAGLLFLDVTLPAFEAQGILLFPPLFMDDSQRGLVIEVASRGTTGASPSPFRVATDEFVPRPRPQLSNGRRESVCLLVFDGGVAYDPGASFEIRPQLLDLAGEPVAAGRFQLLRSVADPDGFRRFVLGFTPAEVPPGDYTLRVRLRDPASGRISEAFQAVRVQ